MKKLPVFLAVLFVFGLVLIVDSAATPSGKVTICHATGSESNPYVLISPSAVGVKSGHIDHQHSGDIIPQFTIENGPHAGTYGPQGDQSILANGCKVPEPEPSPSPSPTPTETPSPTPTPSETPSPSPTPSETPSVSPSPSPLESPTPSGNRPPMKEKEDEGLPPITEDRRGGPGEPLAFTGAGSLVSWIFLVLALLAGAGVFLWIGRRRGSTD